MKHYYLLCVLLLSVNSMHAAQREFQKNVATVKTLTNAIAVSAVSTGAIPLYLALASNVAPEIKPALYSLTGVSAITWGICVSRVRSIMALPGDRLFDRGAIGRWHLNKAHVGEVVGLTALGLAAICKCAA